MAATLAELEARVAALEAERADYKAVLASINVLSQQTRERFDIMDQRTDNMSNRLDGRVDSLGSKLDETNARVRSIEESVAEVKDLLIRALDKK
ncbi:hypothetical protein FOS14_00160 [Skermania sp. ID1734]|uniref:hypothetical protein n=1 Tax=Skermania sp. ID1734 TaxID=2597516 RepID=UPI00117C576F|nr:hypothetical protein [Skermania sp. ID1734]TSE01851.1 hypothetical protein FOS14_00160 [Skermania sp. ID1734]